MTDKYGIMITTSVSDIQYLKSTLVFTIDNDRLLPKGEMIETYNSHNTKQRLSTQDIILLKELVRCKNIAHIEI